MKTYFADQDISIAIPLTRDGEPFVADNNQVSWQLWGHTGDVLIQPTNISAGANGTPVVNISATHGAIDPDRLFEKRTLILKGVASGEPFSIMLSYRISPWLNFTATPADVRKLIGIDDGELPDRDVDLFTAYFGVASILSREALAAALSSGNSQELRANEAIIAQAVLDLLPSLQTRISKTTQDGTHSITRFSLDLNLIRSAAEAQLDKALTLITNRDNGTRVGFVIGLGRTDPVTG